MKGYSTMNKSKVTIHFSILLILILALSNNFSLYLSEGANNNFDSWSNGIMISDLMYRESFNHGSTFLKAIIPGMTVKDNKTIINGDDIRNDFIDNNYYNNEDYFDYTSNICAHRYLYAGLNKILPEKNVDMLYMLELINVILLSAILMYIMYWIKSLSNTFTMIITLAIMITVSPNFIMYAKNLYWAAWSLFIPMATSIWVLNKRKSNNNRFKLSYVMFLGAFISCLIKQLFYFEFISVIMISMMVPYIYHFIIEGNSLKKIIKKSIPAVLGAILSFIVASFVKFLMFINSGNTFLQAINNYIGPIIYRLVGDNNSSDTLVLESSKISLIHVLKIMLTKPAISFKYIIFISQGFLCIILVFITLRLLIKLVKVRWVLEDRSELAYVVVLWISMLAPLSWFILAKPHTYVHNEHCSFVWYLPFTILMISYIVHYISEPLIMDLYTIFNKLKFKISKLQMVIFSIILVSLYFVPKFVQWDMNSKTVNIVRENGEKLYEVENCQQIYLYDNNLYYFTSKKSELINSKYFVHIFDYDNSYNFVNKDFDYNINKLSVFPWEKYYVSKIALDQNFPINRIYTGQYNLYSGERYWETNLFLSEALDDDFIKTISISSLNNLQWNYGINEDGTIILIDDIREEYLYLIGKDIIFDNGIRSTIKDVIFDGEFYTHIILSEPLDSSVLMGENSNRTVKIGDTDDIR